ncbi:MAG: hypothetical protein A2Y34_00615 [Spirochaetes bacterium GWC1_27_15]|nr:MAG: hypothetical protein A2Z98_14530 [Spirochaetes bacterium GWB1_27_13]OHD21908.1 MAG: hypothetical protein A2Y34_00615 [Spirochaetes bacterium GWC1_27_15]
MKKLIIFLFSLFLIFSFGGCKKTTKESIKIGAIFSVTGANAFLGEPEKNTATMLVEKFNQMYPDKKVELIVYDDEGDATKAQNFATKLIEEDGCVAIIGPTLSGTSLKILDLAKENKTPLISCAAAAAIVEPVNEREWIFKTAQSDKLTVTRLYKYISKNNIKNIAIITVSNGFGQSGKGFLESLAKDYGLTIVENQTFGAQDTDMKAQLTKIKSTKPDAIICWGTNPGPAYVVRNAKELGMSTPIYQSHGVGNQKYIDLAGDAIEGTYLVAGKLLVNESLPDTELQKSVLTQYTKEYQEKFGDMPSTFGGHAWDATNLVLNAIEKGVITGNTAEDKAKLRDFIENEKNFVGISGVYNFSKDDHNGLTEDAFSIIQVKNGKWNFVE